MGAFHRFLLLSIGAGALLAGSSAAVAQTPTKDILTPEIISGMRDFIDQDIVRLSIKSQNIKYADLMPSDVQQLDQQWMAEREADSKPLISATLSNPLSAYLTRIQAHSSGLYTEIFVMDKNGLNVGQSNISSDYWQGDEAKFQNTFPAGGTAIFIDEPEFNDKTQTWNAQVNMSISDGQSDDSIGAVTIEVNLTELQRRIDATAPAAPATPAAAPEPAPAPEPESAPEEQPTPSSDE